MSRWFHALAKQAYGPDVVDPLKFADPAQRGSLETRFSTIVGDPRYTERLVQQARSNPDAWNRIASAVSNFVTGVQEQALQGSREVASGGGELLKQTGVALDLLRRLLSEVPAGADTSVVDPRLREGVATTLVAPDPAPNPLPEVDIPVRWPDPSELAEEVVTDEFTPQTVNVPGLGSVDLNMQRILERARKIQPPSAKDILAETRRAPASTDVRPNIEDKFNIPLLWKDYSDLIRDIDQARSDRPGAINDPEAIFAPVGDDRPAEQIALDLLEERSPGASTALFPGGDPFKPEPVPAESAEEVASKIEPKLPEMGDVDAATAKRTGPLPSLGGLVSTSSEALQEPYWKTKPGTLAATGKAIRRALSGQVAAFKGIAEQAEPALQEAKGVATSVARDAQRVKEEYERALVERFKKVFGQAWDKAKGFAADVTDKAKRELERIERAREEANRPWYEKLFDKIRSVDWSGTAKTYGPYALAGAGGLALGSLLRYLLGRSSQRKPALQPIGRSPSRKSKRRKKRREKQGASSYRATTGVQDNRPGKRTTSESFELALDRYAKDPTLDKARTVARLYKRRRRRKRKKSAAELVNMAISSRA